MLLLIFLAAALITLVGLFQIYMRFGLRRLATILAVMAAIGGAAFGVQRLTGCGEDPKLALIDETVDGQRWLRHPRGFAFHHPGADFVADPDRAERLGGIHMTCDAYTRTDGGELAVCAIDELVDTRDRFIAAVNAVRRIVAPAGDGGPLARDGTTVTDDVTWSSDGGRALLHRVLPDGSHFRLAALTVPGGFAVAVAAAPSDRELAPVIASLARR